ncbi:hypothetical protein Leryth_024537 [Lithospermum erythrorhizon]|nr:hypothetical protein Leryth_024537 [Lithospermum erythrorhizon]
MGMVFRSMELQAKWIASVLSGRVKLPSKEDMFADLEQHYKQMKEMDIPKHYTHYLSPFKLDYVDWLAAEVGTPPPDHQVKAIYSDLFRYYFTTQDDNFRDEWKYWEIHGIVQQNY